LDTLLGLTAIGIRHTRLRAEVRKALAAAAHPADEETISVAKAKLVGVVGRFAAMAFDQPEECAQGQRAFGARILVERTAHLPEGDPSRFARAEDVPEDVAMSAALQVEVECLHDPNGVGHLFILLPWLARSAPEDLYLPAPLVRALHRPWTPERTFQV